MGTLCRPLRSVVRVAVGGLLLCVVACSSDANNAATRVLSGLVNVARFEVATGERVQCTADLTVQCQTAVIAGELYSPDASQPGDDAPGITVQATGDVELTGRIATGRGAGSPTKGGDGGDIRLASTGGSLTIGSAAARGRAVQPVLQTGDGGNGADGLLGGAGGDGGAIHLEAPEGELTIHQRPSLLQIGNGGDGGRGVVGGQDLLTFTPPATLPNGGGDSGGVNATWDTVVGAEVAEDPAATPPKVILLDAGVATGGDGGDAGDFFLGVDPVTDTSTWPAPGRTAGRAVPSVVEVAGSNGGNGWYAAGNGSTVHVSYADAEAPAGTEGTGTEVTATGGDGGDVDADFYEMHTRSGLHGGDGGSAFVAAGGGGAGSGCGSGGGAGGKATARGGRGGASNSWVIADELWFPGKGGDATARGGAGGAGGSCCSPPGQAGRGGKGGDADAQGGNGGSAFPQDATRQGAGGDAASVAGDGGTGGDGWPLGFGGDGGKAVATAGWSERQPGVVTKQRDGSQGGGGTACAPPPPQDVLVEVEPNGTSRTATPLGDYNKASGSLDKGDGDVWDFFVKTLAPGSYVFESTRISGDVGKIRFQSGGAWHGNPGDPWEAIPFDVPTEQDILIYLTDPVADRNEYSFEIKNR